MISFPISSKLSKKLQELDNAFAKAYSELNSCTSEEKTALHRYAKISMIGASTRIENAILTDSEINWIDTMLTVDGKPTAFLAHKKLIEDKLSKDKERSIEEVAGCRGMLELIYSQAKEWVPLSETIIRGLHAELLRYYPKANVYLGRYKKLSNSVIETNHATKKSHTVFATAEAGPITEAAMQNLVNWYNTIYKTSAHSITIAAEFVYRFLAIHPFQDGNGRLGRGLWLIVLLQSPHNIIAEVTPYLAIDRQIERHRSEYYSVLNRCSNGKYHPNPAKYHIDYFLEFMIKILNSALTDVKIYQERHAAFGRLSESAQHVLACFKDHPEIRLTAQQISEHTTLPKRTVSRHLTLLTKERFIQRYGQGAGTRYQLIF